MFQILVGTVASLGTSNVPLVTVNVLALPAGVKHWPEPENDPVMRSLMEATVMVPVVSEQTKPNVELLPFQFVSSVTELQDTVVVGVQLALMFRAPVVIPWTVIPMKSPVVLVFATFAATFVLLSVPSVQPVAHVVV